MLSQSRWAGRHIVINVLAYTFEAVVSTLDDFVQGDNKAKSAVVRGLLLQIKLFSYVTI